MKSKNLLPRLVGWGLLVLMLVGLWGCQLPDKPNFQLVQNLQLPLFQKKIQFLGGADAMVDTTKNDLKGYLSTDTDGKVILSTKTSYTQSFTINNIPAIPPGIFNYTFTINLNHDDSTNGVNILDLYDDLEAKIISVPALKYFAKRIGDFSLLNASMHFYYKTNLQSGNTVYAGVVGSDPYRTDVYFMPKPGSPYEVTGNPISGLDAHGSSLSDSQLFTFTTNADSTIGDTTYGSLAFDSTNSNISAFIANLPTSVRFIGKAKVNSSKINMNSSNSIFFETAYGINIPLNIQTSHPASYVDTLNADLSSLPDTSGNNYNNNGGSNNNNNNNKNSYLSSGELNINYENALPLGADITLTFLNQFMQPIATVPDTTAGIPKIGLKAASVDPNTHFTDVPARGIMNIKFTPAQLDTLSETRYIILKANLSTSNNQAVKIQASDFIKLQIGGDFKLNTKVKK